MSTAIFSEPYKISSYLVNLRGQAGLYSILNFVQDVGWLHAMSLKIKLDKNLGWVFTRQKLEMSDWPHWNETITLKTWLREPTSAFILRDYEIYLKDKKIGQCTSTFTVMDLNTRKIAVQDWSQFQNLWRPENHLDQTPEKIIWKADITELTQFQVRNSDIDLNHHVNNTKYAQWILDSIPINVLREGAILKGYEVNFLAECKIGDIISLQRSQKDEVVENKTVIHFQGQRISDQKPVFTAQMIVE